MGARNLLRRWRLDWPLLGKELLEQAARKQMYVVRVVYALVLFGAFCFYYLRHLAKGAVLTLGGGLEPFNFLVTTQMATIFLFLPPLMAGALAQEKERDTLGLLFLTDLTPWELILQKYIGRLIPMLTLLFLSLPLLAVAYSLGGVSSGMLYGSAVKLFLTCLWVGALALSCSAHEASTFQALLRCWGLLLAFSLCCARGPFQFWLTAMMSPPGGLPLFMVMFFTGVGYLLPTFLFLVWARQNVETRAFVQRRNPFGHQFRQLDQYWKDLRKLSRAILRKRDAEARALAEQVIQRGLGATGDAGAWSLSTYLLAKMQVPNVLAFAIIFGVIVVIALAANIMLEPKSGGGFFVVVGGFWVVALLTIPIQSANAVASERMNERLGPILTTPLTTREMLDEWLGPVRRWSQFLMRPLAVIIVLEALVKFETQGAELPRWKNLALSLGLSLLTLWIYPPLVQWSCLWLGLRIHHQIRALMTSLFLVAAWSFLPLAASWYFVQTGLVSGGAGELLNFISPVTIIGAAEALGRQAADSAVTSDMVVLALFHLALAAALMWLFRRICLGNADHYLGRV